MDRPPEKGMREPLTMKTVLVGVLFRIKKRLAHAATPASATPAPSAEVRQQPAAQGTETTTPGGLKSLQTVRFARTVKSII